MENSTFDIKNGNLDQKTLRKLQLTQLEIFKIIDDICRKNQIQYSLYGGTLLGAVRHKGFIPWDDDLDICMTRDNYEHFVSAWKENPVSGYFFQEYENDPGFTRTFGKLRKENTEFLASDEVGKNYHHGIFVDIFPFDKVRNTKIDSRKHQIIGCIYLLYSRGYAPVRNGKLMELGSKVLLALIPRKYYRNIILKCKRYLMRDVGRSDFYYITYSSFTTIKWRLSRKLFGEYEEVDFEDMKAMAFKESDMYLTNTYGDYMQFPPEESRHGSHDIVRIKF